ncbi:MAG: 2-oxoacid:ferredoxin oxidoreductase subunit beta, partial [Alicyclobacillus sp.]|nr:2-oxoacid:ferredoxin oxidoreductase subunit beta [Alicyclobacillus sp.]
KLANRHLTVIAAGGDGDGFGIGMGHFIHAMRRNIDITYVVMDNHIYGLTTGQASPTSDVGAKTKTSPAGTVEQPIAPLQLALAQNCSFVAQGFSGNIKQLVNIMERAIQHKGFSFVNVFSPCVTFNKVNTYEFYKEHLVNLDDDPTYDPRDRVAALRRVAELNNILVGVIYEDPDRPSFEDSLRGYPAEPLVRQNIALQPADYAALLDSFR